MTSVYRVGLGRKLWRKFHYLTYAEAAALFIHSILTDPLLKDSRIDPLDGEKVLVEVCRVRVVGCNGLASPPTAEQTHAGVSFHAHRFAVLSPGSHAWRWLPGVRPKWATQPQAPLNNPQILENRSELRPPPVMAQKGERRRVDKESILGLPTPVEYAPTVHSPQPFTVLQFLEIPMAGRWRRGEE